MFGGIDKHRSNSNSFVMAVEEENKIKRLGWMLAAGWTLVLVVIMAWNLWQVKTHTHELAQLALQKTIEKDLVFRNWATEHGGAYVPATAQTPPNPYLEHIQERDIKTPSGQHLTLVNPAYMMRQVYELGKENNGVHGRLTSLTPISPGNAADPWEAEALKAFTEDIEEISTVTNIDGQPSMRLIRPFRTEEGCLTCHGHQGHQVGDIHGGISAATSMEPYLAQMYTRQFYLGSGYGLIWLIGLGGIGWTTRRLEKLTQEQRESEARYRAIVENTNDALIIHDFRGNILDVNENACMMLGYHRDELLGANLSKIDSPENVQRFRGRRERLLKKDSSVFQGTYIRKDGSEVPVEISAKVVSRFGNGIIQGFARDITDRKNLEEKLREFAATASHELRNPLNNISMLVYSLRDIDDKEIRDEFIEDLEIQTQRLTELVSNLLDLARLERGKDNSPRTIVNMTEIVRETVNTNASQLEREGLKLEYQEENEELPVYGNAEELKQVLQNLLDNASKYTPSGGRIRIEVKEKAEGAMVSVEDTGFGIPSNDLEKIFERFYRVNKAYSRERGGTGLGLSICREIILRHQGKIWAESQERKGSTFYILLPLTTVKKFNFGV